MARSQAGASIRTRWPSNRPFPKGRYRGETRLHTESDLRVFLHWCTDRDLDPLAAVRVDIERYLRWLQDVRRYQPATVSRRLSVVIGFNRFGFWRAVLGYTGLDDDNAIDPLGHGSTACQFVGRFTR